MTWRPVYGPQALGLTQQTYMLKPNVSYFLTQIIPLCVDPPLLAGVTASFHYVIILQTLFLKKSVDFQVSSFHSKTQEQN